MFKYKKSIVTIALLAILFVGFYLQFPPKIEESSYASRDISYQYTNAEDADNGHHFGKSTWSAAHRDSRNSDYIPLVSPSKMVRAWDGIEGGNFFMGPIIGPDGNVYATSAGGVGESNLHAFDNAGNVLWKSEPMLDKDDLDSAAFFSAPVVDVDNNIFLPDENQLWSYDNKGNVRWVRDLSDYGINGFVFTVVFTKEGYGILTSSDGIVALFNRENGDLMLGSIELPGVNGVQSGAIPEGLFANGLVDEQILQDSWEGIWGFNMEVANTTSVDPETNRLFVVATGRKPEEIVVYGIDVTKSGLRIAFETLVGVNGSGTSPTLSFDGKMVYVADGKGIMNGISTDNGEIIWKSANALVTGVSPTVTPDNKILSFNTETISCIDNKTGEIIWTKDVSDMLISAGLDKKLRGITKIYGENDGSLMSGIMATEDGIWFIAVLNTLVPIPEDKRGSIDIPIEGIRTDVYAQPLKYFLIKADYDGNVLSATDFVDGGALMAMGLDGKIFVTTLSVASSIAFYNANQKMPFFMRNTPKPHGGLIAYEPASYYDYFKVRIENNMKRAEKMIAENKVNQNDLMRLNLSLSSNHLSLIESLTRKEIDHELHDVLHGKLEQVRNNLPKNLAQVVAAKSVLSEIVSLF